MPALLRNAVLMNPAVRFGGRSQPKSKLLWLYGRAQEKDSVLCARE